MFLLSFSCRLLEVKLTRTDKVNQFWGAVTLCDHNTTGTCRRKSWFLSQWLTASHSFLRSTWGALIFSAFILSFLFFFFSIYLLLWLRSLPPSALTNQSVLANVKCISTSAEKTQSDMKTDLTGSDRLHQHVWHKPERSCTARLESVVVFVSQVWLTAHFSCSFVAYFAKWYLQLRPRRCFHTHRRCGRLPCGSWRCPGGSRPRRDTSSPRGRENPPLAVETHWSSPHAPSALRGQRG